MSTPTDRKKHLSFAEHVGHVLVDTRFVLLDLKKDKYIFLDTEHSLTLTQLLKFKKGAQQPKINPEAAAALKNSGLLIRTEQPQTINDYATPPEGIDVYQWRLVDYGSGVSLKILSVANTLARYLWLRSLIKLKRIFQLFQSLENKMQRSTLCAAPTQSSFKEIEETAMQMRQASLILPFRVDCFEHALALALCLAQQKIAFSFCIGIQLDPFLAHAWISINERVVVDRNDLPQKLAVIFQKNLTPKTGQHQTPGVVT